MYHFSGSASGSASGSGSVGSLRFWAYLISIRVRYQRYGSEDPDPQIQIRTKMLQIRNIGCNNMDVKKVKFI